jgi:thiamine-monophosphate kinase
MNKRNEIEWVDYIRQQFTQGASHKNLFIGDDCAIFEPAQDEKFIVSTDMLVEHIHFTRQYFRPEEIGKRALAVNLSDIAAMGGCPLYYLLGLGIPENYTDKELENFFEGCRETGQKFGIQLIGGDLNRTGDIFIIGVTVIGNVQSRTQLQRSGARTGDLLCVSGTLGDSKLGMIMLNKFYDKNGSEVLESEDDEHGRRSSDYKYLVNRHKLPEPRIREGLILARSGTATAAIDISDGLTIDLERLVQESGVGCRVQLKKIPVSDAAQRFTNSLDLNLLELAVSGGEDFELLFTINPQSLATVEREFKDMGTKLSVIGEILEQGAGITYIDINGESVTPPRGYLHF